MKIYFIVTIALFLSACNNSEPIVKKIKEKQTSIKAVKVLKNNSNRPLWISNPDLDGNIGSVGVVSKMSNKKKQKYIAKKIAIADLQERKRVLISSKVNEKTKIKNGEKSLEMSSEIEQTSSQFNADKIIQKGEFSGKNNYYVWMVIQK